MYEKVFAYEKRSSWYKTDSSGIDIRIQINELEQKITKCRKTWIEENEKCRI